MMRLLISTSAFLLTTCLYSATLSAQDSVRWLTSAQEAADEAARTGKPILVYVRSASCYYCDLMQKDVWQNPQAASVIKRDFVPLKLTHEKNPEAVEALQVKSFPSTIVFSPKRKYLHRIDGYVKSAEFLLQMKKLRTAGNPSTPRR